MFSSKGRISFVFANEDDVFYGDDLLKLDLNQYLWKQLHESYKTVYFLSADGNVFSVTSFGDWRCKPYEPERKKLISFGKKTEEQEQGNWILQQLEKKPKEAVAFVCPMADFCRVLSDQRWNSVLEDIVEAKKISGKFVLTASAAAEDTTELLLKSPVFTKLREHAVIDLRTDVELNLYSTLKKRKGDDCQFLNRFTWDRIRAMLLHLVMAYPSRFESCDQLDRLADYLSAYLRNPDMAEKERLLPGNLPAEYFTYELLYEHLSKKFVWENLLQLSANHVGYLGLERWEDSSEHAPVLRDSKSYAGRCMRLRLPKAVREDEKAGVRAQELLRTIRGKVSTPKNRLENRTVTAAAEGFLNRLDGMSGRDVESYLWTLRALAFCVDQVYLPDDSEKLEAVEANIKIYQTAIALSAESEKLQNKLLEFELPNIAVKGAVEIGRQQIEMQLYAHRERCRQCDELVTRAEAGLQTVKVDNAGAGITEMIGVLGTYLQPQTPTPMQTPIWQPIPETEPEPVEEDRTEYNLDDDWLDDDIIIKPPKY